MTVEELLAKQKQANEDFVKCFRQEYNKVDNWIREYDRWYRLDNGQLDKIYAYRLINICITTPTEAGAAEYDELGRVKAIQLLMELEDGKPVVECQEGVYEGNNFVPDGTEEYNIPFDRCFPIFVEMLEAYDNLMRG